MFSFLSPHPFLGFPAPPSLPSCGDSCCGRGYCVLEYYFCSRAKSAFVGGSVWNHRGSRWGRRECPGTHPVGSIPGIGSPGLAALRPPRLGSGDQPLEPSKRGRVGAGALEEQPANVWRPAVAPKPALSTGWCHLEIRPNRGANPSRMDNFWPLPKQSVRIPSAGNVGSLFAHRTLPCPAQARLDPGDAVGFKAPNGGSGFFRRWKGRFGMAFHSAFWGGTLGRMFLGSVWAFGCFGGVDVAAQTKNTCVDPVAVAARWADQNAP